MPDAGGVEESEPLTGPNPKEVKKKPLSSTKIVALIWFATACCVFASGILGFVTIFFTEFDPPDCLDEVYLMIFGFIMMLHETPIDPGPLKEIKEGISHQAMFLTRIVGRGAFFLFLGTMTFFTLAENVSLFFSLTLGLFVILVGFLTIVYGHAKTRQLERVRYRIYLETDHAKKVQDLFEQYAVEDAKSGPPRGLSKAEFNKLADDVMTLRNHQLQIAKEPRRLSAEKNWVSFDKDNIDWIFSAIVTCPEKDFLSLVDLEGWCKGSWTLL